MDYMVNGRIKIHTPEELKLLLDAQASLRKNIIKNGTISRYSYEGRPDLFIIDYRTDKPRDARNFFHMFTAFLEAADISGWAAWHECRHAEVTEECTWNEEFTHVRSGGDT